MMEPFAISHPGLKREENQDRLVVREFDKQTLLMAVADGMGGEAGGGLAAQIAIEAVQDFTPDLLAMEASFKKIYQAADRRVQEEIEKNLELEGMGTTLTAAYIENGITYWAHVGDSRLYLWRAGRLTQMTEDHTFVNSLVKDGTITQGEADVHPMQNILLHCIGCDPLEISSGRFKIFRGDLVLLSTDGLHHGVPEREIVSILRKEIGIRKKFEELIRAALKAGGQDNITIVGLTM
ncbi:MAG: serine/threonine-protein phosphatase [Deltaproteobacteria bacterium]|nr:serine/threonine-protein phosphatase [Deltaproteobacteria bacterium]